MHIPVSYWQTQGGGIPHVKGNYFGTVSSTPSIFPYKFNNVSFTGSITVPFAVNSVCKDIVNQNDVYRKYQYSNPAGAFFFCSANEPSGTININTPPNTGAEAWYINLSYQGQGVDRGTYYYSYVNQLGEIVNDTLVFNQTKTIIAQGPPITFQDYFAFVDYRIDYTIGDKFLGNTVAFPYTDMPVDVTFQLKRTRTGGSTYDFPSFRIRRRDFQNGFPINSNSGSTIGIIGGSLNGTTVLGTIGIPIPETADQASDVIVPCTWITNISPQAKGAYNITSCLTTHSLWITLNNYEIYPTGSVFKVSTPALAATSSCWRVTNLTSSLSTSVALTNVNVLETYNTCSACSEPTRYNITNCETLTSSVATFSSTVTTGSVIYSSDLGYNCFTIASTASATASINLVNVNVTSTYSNCADCTGSFPFQKLYTTNNYNFPPNACIGWNTGDRSNYFYINQGATLTIGTTIYVLPYPGSPIAGNNGGISDGTNYYTINTSGSITAVNSC